MKKQVLQLCALALFFAVGCGADKNSNEACLHETTMNLDTGNYDAVLASSCADSMHKGAAYFGKAGYSAKDVINRFSETSNSASTTSDLSTYMNTLTGQVTENTLTNIDLAKINYCTYIGGTIDPLTAQCTNTNQGVPNYQDAQFYISLVDAVKSLSLLKIVTDSTGLGTLSSCNINSTATPAVPDDADATSCALIASNNLSGLPVLTCSTGVSYSTTSDIVIQGKIGTYRGVTVTVTGTATTSCPAPALYKKLLYKDAANKYWLATTMSGENCTDGTTTWPCPIEQSGAPLDLVTAIDQSITSAISSMDQALPEGTTTADVQQSISDIKNDACGVDMICTSADLASYLQTIQ